MPAPRRLAPRASIVVLVALLGLALLAPATALADTDLDVGWVAHVAYANGDNVRLRVDPGYDASIVTSIPEGTTVDVLDGPFEAEDGSLWYFVAVDGTSGFMVADYLAAGPGSGATSGGDTLLVTSDLNLRTGPSLADEVLTIMPTGATVVLTGESASGFLSVFYDGADGWAFGAYLGTEVGDAGDVGGALITSDLNLRAGPSLAGDVLVVMPEGDVVTLTGDSADGFLSVSYDGTDGWAFGAYLDADFSGDDGGDEATVTSDVNLRAGPSLDDDVLLVMPPGATVLLTGDSAGGFLSVSYDGTDGWASVDYVDTDGGFVADSAVTTSTLNLRTGPSLAESVLLIMPEGVEVETTGGAENGFYPVAYAGRDGWASADFLDFDGTAGPGAGGSMIVWPMESGAAWRISQGYNGSSHQNLDSTWQYYYSFDLVRVDGATAGQPVLSPVNGTIRWIDYASGGMSIDLGNGYAYSYFHTEVDPSLAPGQTVYQGQYLGYVSYPGGGGNGGFPHLHITVWSTNDGGNWSRVAVPFTGDVAISGQAFPDIGGGNQYVGTVIYP